LLKCSTTRLGGTVLDSTVSDGTVFDGTVVQRLGLQRLRVQGSVSGKGTCSTQRAEMASRPHHRLR
jgi:hypothetical protein